jgi:hypothetical protein
MDLIKHIKHTNDIQRGIVKKNVKRLELHLKDTPASYAPKSFHIHT